MTDTTKYTFRYDHPLVPHDLEYWTAKGPIFRASILVALGYLFRGHCLGADPIFLFALSNNRDATIVHLCNTKTRQDHYGVYASFFVIKKEFSEVEYYVSHVVTEPEWSLITIDPNMTTAWIGSPFIEQPNFDVKLQEHIYLNLHKKAAYP